MNEKKETKNIDADDYWKQKTEQFEEWMKTHFSHLFSEFYNSEKIKQIWQYIIRYITAPSRSG